MDALADMSSLNAMPNAFVLSRSGSFVFRDTLKSKQRINAHTGDGEAVYIDLFCFMEAYEAQIRLKASASLASSLNKIYEACLFFLEFLFSQNGYIYLDKQMHTRLLQSECDNLFGLVLVWVEALRPSQQFFGATASWVLPVLFWR